MKLIALSTAICLALQPALAGDNLPDLGESAQGSFSAQQERVLGNNIMREVRAYKDYFEDPEVVNYLNNLGGRLVSNSTDKGRAFEFFLMRDNTLNAFALPGAFVGVHTGLILAAENESELASVLAHEIGHVTQRHIARQIAGQERSGWATLAALALAILAARSNAQAAQAAIVGAQAAGIQSQLNYSREYEQEADRTGVELLSKTGFDARGAVSFFERLQRNNRVYDTNAPQYLQTHPLTSGRIADIQNRVEQLPTKQVQDSLEFKLVRAKLRALLHPTKDALRYFESLRLEGGQDADVVAGYGLAAVSRRMNNYPRAEKELAIARNKVRLAMIENLAAQLKRDMKDPKAALAIYQTGLKRFGDDRALNYGYVETLIETNETTQALRILADRLLITSSDAELYDLQGKAYAAQGKKLLQHQSLAEAYVRIGNLSAAVDQLQIAARSGDGDYYQQSSVEARLKELRNELAAERKSTKAN
ncbi:MAG: M48 family metalloprotease [Pseudomonadota bacterium]|nr:M48 family metalloprotease [Pseudomonadota bacterium]